MRVAVIRVRSLVVLVVLLLWVVVVVVLLVALLVGVGGEGDGGIDVGGAVGRWNSGRDGGDDVMRSTARS